MSFFVAIYRIVDSDENDMTVNDFGYIFGPIIMRAQTPSVVDQQLQNYIVELMVTEYESLFRMSKNSKFNITDSPSDTRMMRCKM